MRFFRSSIALGVAVFIVLLAVVYAMLVFMLGARISVVLENPSPVLLYLVFFFAGEAVRAVRLRLVYWRITGVEPSLARSFLARLAGNIVSYLTPSAIGGEIVRGAVIAGASGLSEHGLARLVAAGLADGLYDLFSNTFLAFIFTPFLGGFHPVLLLPLVLGVGASGLWFAAALGFSSERASFFLSRLGRRVPHAVVEGSRAFLKGFDSRARGLALALSFLAWFLSGAGFYFIVSSTCGRTESVLGSIGVLLYTYLMGIIPLPAGLGSMDFWLALETCPTCALVWRTSVLLQLVLAVIIVGPLAAREISTALRQVEE